MNAVFISHISEEALLAEELKDIVESTFLGQYSVFVSSDSESIRPGDNWLEKINSSIEDAKLMLILCSKMSVGRPWINFEAGCGWVKRIPIIPICHSGLTKS